MTIGGPSNILPDTPDNLRRAGLIRKDLAILCGTTKHDGSYVTTGDIIVVILTIKQ